MSESTRWDRWLFPRALLAVAVGLLAISVAGLFSAAILASVAYPNWEGFLLTPRLAEAVAVTNALPDALSWLDPKIAMGVGTILVSLLVTFPLFLLNRFWMSTQVLSWKAVTKALIMVSALIGFTQGLSKIPNAADPASATAFSPAGYDLTLLFFSLYACFAYLFFGEKTFGGHPDDRLKNPDRSREGFKEALRNGIAAGPFIFSALLVGLSIDRDSATFYKAIATLPQAMAEPTPWPSSLYLFALVFVSTGLPFGAMLFFTFAFSPGRCGWKSRTLTAGAGFVTLFIALLLNALALRYCNLTADMRFASLSEAASLEPEPPSRLMVLPGDGGPKAVPYPMHVESIFSDAANDYPATPKNVELVTRYLEAGSGRWTYHTADAYHSRANMLYRMLLPREALSARLESALEANCILDITVCVASLSRMPLTPESRNVAEALLDPGKFIQAGLGQKMLIKPALHVDDVERAGLFWDRAMEAGTDMGETKRPDNKVWRGGELRGKIEMGNPGKGARLALYHKSNPADLGGDSKDFLGHGLLLGLIDAVDLGGTDEFRFGGLREGYYYIGVLVPPEWGSEPGDVTADGDLGPFRIREETPAQDSALIRIARK